MKVKELISKLQEHDTDLDAMVDNEAAHAYCEIVDVEVC